jgi:hypothetical protein
MKRDDDALYDLIKESDEKGKITSFFDLLKAITLDELSRLVEMPAEDIVRWATNPGTMPANIARQFCGFIELPHFVVEEMFGIRKHPAYEELQQYKAQIDNSPYGKLQDLVALAEEVKRAFEGAIEVTITFKIKSPA